jgi:hypothetical protein
MNNFHWVGDELYCEQVPISLIAQRFGTKWISLPYKIQTS